MNLKNLFNRRFVLGLVILSLLHLGFLYYAVRHNSYLLKDSYEYLAQAYNIASGEGWYAGDLSEKYQPHLESRRPPLYAVLVSLIQILFKNNIFILLVQNLLSLLNFAGLCYLIYRFKLKKYLLLIIIPFLFFPSQFIFSNTIMAEILFQTCIFWSFFFIVLFMHEKYIMLLILHSLFIALGIMVKPALYLFWIIEIAIFIYLFFREKISIYSIAYSMIPAVTVLLMSLYNEQKTGYFHYSSLKTTNLIAYNTYKTLRLDYPEEEAKNILDSIYQSASDRSDNFKELSEELENSAWEIISNNVTGYFLLQANGMINFFIDAGRHDIFSFFTENFRETEQGIVYYYKNEGFKGVINYLYSFSIFFVLYYVLILIINFILLASVISFIFNKNISAEIRLITILIIFYIAFITGPIGSARFKVAVYPQILFTLPFFIDLIKNSHFYRKLKWP